MILTLLKACNHKYSVFHKYLILDGLKIVLMIYMKLKFHFFKKLRGGEIKRSVSNLCIFFLR
jgi:hypothetical protein